MKTKIFSLVLISSLVFGGINTMEFNGTSTTSAGVEFTFSTGLFTNSIDGTTLSLFSNHPYANMINGGGDYKDINISQSIFITSVNVTWSVNVENLKLQFLNGETVVKEISSPSVGDLDVNISADKIRFMDTDFSSSGGFELATVSWDSPLPVELTEFSAEFVENNMKLEWETATEVNNYGFEIERTSEKNDWSKVGFVEGHGNSNSPKYYSFSDNSLNESGEYSYRLKQIDIDGSFEYSDIVNINLSAPNNFKLSQNYPNPFNPITSINYSVSDDSYVVLIVYDILGNEVAVLENGYRAAGSYNRTFDASNLGSGLYFYSIKAGNYSSTMKMLLMK